MEREITKSIIIALCGSAIPMFEVENPCSLKILRNTRDFFQETTLFYVKMNKFSLKSVNQILIVKMVTVLVAVYK